MSNRESGREREKEKERGGILTCDVTNISAAVEMRDVFPVLNRFRLLRRILVDPLDVLGPVEAAEVDHRPVAALLLVVLVNCYPCGRTHKLTQQIIKVSSHVP